MDRARVARRVSGALLAGLAFLATSCGAPEVAVPSLAPLTSSAAPAVPSSPPVSMVVNGRGIGGQVVPIGVDSRRELDITSLDARPANIGWFKHSKNPGDVGPSVFVAHVDYRGPAAFYLLRNVKNGDWVSVTRADKSVAVFKVTRTEQIPKNQFPTMSVYGPTGERELRLITCAGTFRPNVRSYSDNLIVYAKLVRVDERVPTR